MWHGNTHELDGGACLCHKVQPLYLLSVLSVGVVRSFGFRPIALVTTDLVASSMHLILNDRAECIARVDDARGRIVTTFGRELLEVWKAPAIEPQEIV